MFLLGFILYGTLCASWTWLTISFSMLEKFSNYNLSKIFSCPFFSSSSSGTPIIQMLVHLILCQRSLRLSSVLFILFTYSALHKLFPPFYIPAHWFILLLQIFCYWFLLEHSCLENLMGRGAWWAAVHGVAKIRTRLSNFTFTFHFHALEKEMATHSSVLAWRIPGTGEPCGLPSKGSHRVIHDWSDLAAGYS